MALRIEARVISPVELPVNARIRALEDFFSGKKRIRLIPTSLADFRGAIVRANECRFLARRRSGLKKRFSEFFFVFFLIEDQV